MDAVDANSGPNASGCEKQDPSFVPGWTMFLFVGFAGFFGGGEGVGRAGGFRDGESVVFYATLAETVSNRYTMYVGIGKSAEIQLNSQLLASVSPKLVISLRLTSAASKERKRGGGGKRLLSKRPTVGVFNSVAGAGLLLTYETLMADVTLAFTCQCRCRCLPNATSLIMCTGWWEATPRS